MKSVVIYYFSGTGNTALVAGWVREEFAALGYEADLVRMEDVLKAGRKPDTARYDLVAIGCPVLGYGAPLIARRFIRRLPKAGGKACLLFRTAGGVAPCNYNASAQMTHMLARRGYRVTYERIFSIGSNWIVKFDEAVMRRLAQASREKVAAMCRAEDAGGERILKTGAGLRALMALAARASAPGLRLAGRDLACGPACTHCGLCARNCPTGNIREKNGRMRFGWSCCSCMRCVYACPKQAIGHRLLRFFEVPGGYNVDQVLNGPAETGADSAGKTPAFFAEYIQNGRM